MDLQYGEKYSDFRKEVRAFLEENAPLQGAESIFSEAGRRALTDWLNVQIEAGLWARTVPKELGGYGADPDLMETVIMDEEFHRASKSRGFAGQGPSMLVPTLLAHGTDEQRKRWIGPTLRAEVLWCQGYSEPGSGSDLASLQTSAKEDGDDFLINGQKIWTSHADVADMMFVLCRTEPDAPKHGGISYVLLPMDTPGLEVQPLDTMSAPLGENSFNQVFFSDVRVPQANVVGKRGEGWKIANTTLKHERASLNSAGGAVLTRLKRLMTKETVNGVPAMASPIYRDRLMKLEARVIAMKYHALRLLSCTLHDRNPGVAGLVTKLQNCQLNFDMAALAIDVMGELGTLYDHTKYEREKGFWQSHSMISLGLIIGGGTAQIQKNIISERGLGMPREPKPAKA